MKREREREREREMFYLTTHSTHFIYSYMASDIWLRTIGYSYQLTARVLLYAPSHRQDNTYHSLCYTSRGALAGMRNSSMGPPLYCMETNVYRTMNKTQVNIFVNHMCRFQCLIVDLIKFWISKIYILFG